MSMDQVFATFLEEASELLQNMESCLLDPEQHADEEERVNSLFRAAHTIKGSAGIFGLEPIVEFTHMVESVLDRVREQEIVLDDMLTGVLLLCKDYTQHQIDCIDNGEVKLSREDKLREQGIVAQLIEFLPNGRHGKMPAVTGLNAPEAQIDVVPAKQFSNDNWHISVRFGRECIRYGMDPIALIHHLGTVGEIVHLECMLDALPAFDEIEPDGCYLGFELSLRSEAQKVDIEDVFEFVRDDCELHILPPNARATDFIDIIESLDSDDLKLGEILVQCGTLTESELAHILSLQQQRQNSSDEKNRLGQLIVEQQLVAPEVVEAALKKQSQNQGQPRTGRERQSRFVRVDADKLDTLINLIGELVTSSAGISAELKDSGINHLIEAALPMSRLVEDVRDCALNLRMVQIGETFNRFHRVVRDVATSLGKDIRLEIRGAETELDKTVIEKIGDPLTHLVRNAIDHGIENPDVRVAQGKPAQGTVTLNARHESGSIVIEVSDDGGGLNCERILQKAIEKGLVDAQANLSQQEIFQLIFEAGFSTAAAVSDISGRGVGMDVVRRNIEALRGSIEVISELNLGTMIRVRLPLTLAIIDGFLVRLGGNTYVIPLDMVVECLELSPEQRLSEQAQSYISLRGEVLPFVRLRELFVSDGAPSRRESIVVVQYGDKRAGLAVDMLLGEFQTVIKPLGKIFESLSGIAGSTILGSGEVALILDIPTLLQHVEWVEKNFVSDAEAASAGIKRLSQNHTTQNGKRS